MFGPARKEQLLRAEQVNLDEVAMLAARGVHYLGSDTPYHSAPGYPVFRIASVPVE